MECTVDLKDVKDFIESDKFTQFLINNTTDIGTALFILQTINDKLEELMEE